jgi:hypothetical protein
VKNFTPQKLLNVSKIAMIVAHVKKLILVGKEIDGEISR